MRKYLILLFLIGCQNPVIIQDNHNINLLVSLDINNCNNGGIKIIKFRDYDDNHKINGEDEELETHFVCNGDNGDIGLTGLQGLKGDQGEIGIQGPQGVQGVQGPQGLKGDQGDKGNTGDTGPQGSQGIQGIQGEQGVQGEKGDKGDTGDPGTQITITKTDISVNACVVILTGYAADNVSKGWDIYNSEDCSTISIGNINNKQTIWLDDTKMLSVFDDYARVMEYQ